MLCKRISGLSPVRLLLATATLIVASFITFRLFPLTQFSYFQLKKAKEQGDIPGAFCLTSNLKSKWQLEIREQVKLKVKMFWQLAKSLNTGVFAQVSCPALENGAMKHHLLAVTQEYSVASSHKLHLFSQSINIFKVVFLKFFHYNFPNKPFEIFFHPVFLWELNTIDTLYIYVVWPFWRAINNL